MYSQLSVKKGLFDYSYLTLCLYESQLFNYLLKHKQRKTKIEDKIT